MVPRKCLPCTENFSWYRGTCARKPGRSVMGKAQSVHFSQDFQRRKSPSPPNYHSNNCFPVISEPSDRPQGPEAESKGQWRRRPGASLPKPRFEKRSGRISGQRPCKCSFRVSPRACWEKISMVLISFPHFLSLLPQICSIPLKPVTVPAQTHQHLHKHMRKTCCSRMLAKAKAKAL